MLKYLLIPILALSYLCSYGQDDYTSNVDTALMRGDAYVAKFQYGKAVAQYYECVRAERNPVYINKLAFCYYQLGNNSDAKIYYKQALKYDSTNIVARIYLGSLAERESDYQSAMGYYDELIGIDSTSAHYYKLKAKVAMRAEHPLIAFYAYNQVLAFNPDDIETVAELAKIYLQLGDLDSAEQMLKKGETLNSKNLTIRYLQTNVAYKRDSFTQVVNLMEPILANGDTVNHYEKLLAMSYMELDRFEDARIHLLRLTKNEKPNELTYYRLAQTYDQLDSTDQSIAAYDQAIEIGISRNVGAYYKNIGILHLDNNELKQAMNAFRDAYYFSKRLEDLFQLARCQDRYYADKKIALNSYKKFLRLKDKKKPLELIQYAESRVMALKSEIFQRGG